ncbi:hypothetical protein HRI_002334600 [Hibiscus trionum]|uniref:Uncharacterized protein n=1 Tax=Hibiscus trionum TaxID=183268 RepID=A0A9W7I082_HIBTR|nr:hypothetical protein HRI_002334600 [Hibiscus trionum]
MSRDLGSSVELQGLLLLMMSDSDMATAAQQLMQLSDEDNSSSSSSINSDGNNNQSEGWFTQSRCDITSAMIEEIFGKEEISRPTKKRKYRFLESIYKETKPMKVNYGNDLRYSTKP